MARAAVILSGLLLLVCQVRGQHNALPAKEARPNFVLIVADDLGYGDLGIHGSLQIPTPNIDRIAKEGILFTNGYASSTVCAPSRAGLLTGKHQAGFGFTDNLAGNQPGYDPEYLGLPVNQTTVADQLKKLGYTNGIIGKWHLGAAPKFHPLKRGFDECWSFMGGGHDYYSAKEDGVDLESPISCNYKRPAAVTYLTDDIGDESVAFVKRHAGSPFFLYAAFNAPHSPMQALEKDLQLFNNITDKMRQTYCAMVYRLDQNVGKILRAIQEQGLEKNTVVIFISDNGGPANSISNGSINAPLRGQKTTLLEGGIRVPFFMKWPAKISPGQTLNDPVSTLDLCPSFIAAAGGTASVPDQYSGVNLLPYLMGERERKPHTAFVWNYTVGTAIREGEWKLIRLPDRLPMLYNLSADIAEQHDISLQNPDKTKLLLQKLGNWELNLPYPLFREPVDWKKRHLSYYTASFQLTQPR
jgi:arylsulfatase A-like enzyme